MQEFIISKKDSGQTAIKYLNRILPSAPGGLLYKQIRKKNITLNGKKMTGSEKLAPGDVLTVFMSDDTIKKFSFSEVKDISEYVKAFEKFGKPNIVYEDPNIILLYKPVGILSQKSSPTDLSANEWLIGYLLNNEEITKESLGSFTPSICNRLDRNTGGILLFGKSLFGSSFLSECIKKRSVEKYYLTAVKGRVKDQTRIEGYLSKDNKLNRVYVSEIEIPESDKIVTEYKPLKYNSSCDITLLEVKLITGKSHQIRAHLASIGHPVIGDFKYGDSSLNNSLKLKNQLLYAYKIVFPKTKDYPEISGRDFTLDLSAVFDKYFED